MHSYVTQRIKSLPVIGKIAVGAKRNFDQVWRRQGWFGNRNKQLANLKRFRDVVTQIPDREKSPVFVKVGANDGVTMDPCMDILNADPRWHGLMIEPVPYLYKRLQNNFPDRSRFQFAQVAVGPSGEDNFYFIDPAAKYEFPELPDWFDQIGSFDHEHIIKHFGNKLNAFVREMSIRIEPLSDILTRHNIFECHLLQIDTEGFDYKVLSTLDFCRMKPSVIFIEHRHLTKDERKDLLILLKVESYIIHDCGSDYFAELAND